MARSRLAVGIAGAAGMSRSRVVALLARAAAVGALVAPLDRPATLAISAASAAPKPSMTASNTTPPSSLAVGGSAYAVPTGADTWRPQQ